MRSYRPEELFDERGALIPELAALPPRGNPADEREPRGKRRRAAARSATTRLPRTTRSRCRVRGDKRRGDPGARDVPARRDRPEPDQFQDVRTGRNDVEPARRGLRGDRPDLGRRNPPDGRPPRTRRTGHGGALRAPVPGLARGVPAHRSPRPVQLLRGLHPHRRLDVQPARQVAQGHPRPSLAPPDRLAQLPPARSLVWRQDHNGFSHQDPGSSTTS